MNTQNYQLRQWPETDNYLERVGQINNDLMLAREIEARENLTQDWLDDLAIGMEDLEKTPDGVSLLKFLYARNVRIESATMLPGYQDIVEEYEAEMLADEETPVSVLEWRKFTTMGSKFDEQLFALPELVSKLTNWAQHTLLSNDLPRETPTLMQAFMIVNLSQFLDQEWGMNPVWAGESMRCLHSSDSYKRAGGQLQKNE